MTIKFEFAVSEKELQQIISETNAAAKETDDVTAAEYDEALQLLMSLDGKEFFKLVDGSKADNRFHVDPDGDLSILNRIPNAYDCYCDAVSTLTHFVNDEYENFMFSQILDREYTSDSIAAFNVAKAIMGMLR